MQRNNIVPPVFSTLVLLTCALSAHAVLPPQAHTQAARVRHTSATLTGMVLPNNADGTFTWFEVGTRPKAYDTVTPIRPSGGGDRVVYLTEELNNLQSGKSYFYRLVSSNAAGVNVGLEQRFITGGKVDGWGTAVDGAAAAPLSLRDAVGIAAGPGHSAAVRANGTIVRWGRSPEPPADLQDVVQIALGRSHAVALRADGTVAAWGLNNFGQTTMPVGLTNVIAVAAGDNFSSALLGDGTLLRFPAEGDYTPITNIVAIGARGTIHLALTAGGSVLGVDNTVVPKDLTNVVAISVSPRISQALKADGTVWTWSMYSQLATNALPGISNVVAISSGSPRLALLDDNRIVGLDVYSEARLRYMPHGFSASIALACGTQQVLGLRELLPEDSVPAAYTQAAFPGAATNAAVLNGMALPNGLETSAWFEWGRRGGFSAITAPQQVGDHTSVIRVSAELADLEAGDYQFRLAVSNSAGVKRGAIALFTTGQKVAHWGRNASRMPVPATAHPAVRLAAGHNHSLALGPGGTVTAWMEAGSSSSAINLPNNLSNIVDLAAGWESSFALHRGGYLTGWGTFYHPGVGTYDPVFVPAGLSNFVALAAGDAHAIALKTDGTVISWGFPWPPGDASTSPSGLEDVVGIAASSYSSFALRANGQIVSWGGNSDYRLEPPAEATNVVSVSAESFIMAAITENQEVVTWGDLRRIVTMPTNVVSAAPSMRGVAVLTDDGRVYVFGNSPELESVPTGLHGVVAISAGDNHCLALAPNVPPQSSPALLSLEPGNSGTLTPQVYDPNGDALQYTLLRLPEVSGLYQFVGGRPGGHISAGDMITDAIGRVIVQTGNSPGVHEIQILAHDGELYSDPARIVVQVVPRPSLVLSHSLAATNGVSISANGIANTSYSLWTSTNLLDWQAVGTVSNPPDGNVVFQHPTSTNDAARYFRVTSP